MSLYWDDHARWEQELREESACKHDYTRELRDEDGPIIQIQCIECLEIIDEYKEVIIEE